MSTSGTLLFWNYLKIIAYKTSYVKASTSDNSAINKKSQNFPRNQVLCNQQKFALRSVLHVMRCSYSAVPCSNKKEAKPSLRFTATPQTGPSAYSIASLPDSHGFKDKKERKFGASMETSLRGVRNSTLSVWGAAVTSGGLHPLISAGEGRPTYHNIWQLLLRIQ